MMMALMSETSERHTMNQAIVRSPLMIFLAERSSLLLSGDDGVS